MSCAPRIDRRSFLAGLGVIGAQLVLPTWAGTRPPRFQEIEASGSAGEIGQSIGRQCRAPIERNVGLYLDWLHKRLEIGRPRALRIASAFTKVLEDHAPQLLEEMEGLAKGSGRSVAEILLLNARTDLLVMGRNRDLPAPAPGPAGPSPADDDLNPIGAPGKTQIVPGCTALALTGQVDGQARLALGQNWDWRPVFAGNTVILRIARRGAPRLVTLTEAGMVGKIGCNELRLGVCLNFLSHHGESPAHKFGLPVHVLLRLMMESESMARAAETLAWSPRCASANFLLAQHQASGPVVLDIEWTPDALARLDIHEHTLVHTNHFRNPALAGGRSRKLGRSTTNRLEVATRLGTQLQTKLPDPVDRMKRILSDRSGAPYSVSRSPGPESPSRTLASWIMDLSSNRIIVAAGQPHATEYLEIPGP